MKELSNEKTTMEWLYWAKEQGFEWADAAIENAKREVGEHYKGGFWPSLDDALCVAFIWGNSPQGHEHWEKISDSLTC